MTVLPGPSSADIGPALESVAPHVDYCLVAYPSGMHPLLGSLLAAQQVVGDKLVVLELDASLDDWGAMVDSSLSWAGTLGAAWAVLISPGERLVLGEQLQLPQLVEQAEAAGAAQLSCYYEGQGQTQVRAPRVIGTST